MVFRLYNSCLSTQYCRPADGQTSPPGGDAWKLPVIRLNLPLISHIGPGQAGAAEIAYGRYAKLKYARGPGAKVIE